MSSIKHITADIGTFVKKQIANALNIDKSFGDHSTAFKQGNVVSVYLAREGYTPGTTDWVTQDTLPAGFKPLNNMYIEYKDFRVRIEKDGSIDVQSDNASKSITLYFNFTYIV